MLLSTINGSKVVVPPLLFAIVVLGVFVPHQLSVAVTVPAMLLRLTPPPVAVFPASLLN